MTGISITVRRDFYNLRIYIDGALHVHIKRAEFLGMQSWRDGPDNFSIEYTLKGGTMLTEYTDETKWRSVLTGLEAFL